MGNCPPTRRSEANRGGAAIAAALALALLAGCAATDVRVLPVSSGAAAASVSAYRARTGLGPVAPNARLDAIAARQATAMAKRRRLGHSLDGSLQKRLASGGYVWAVAVENVGAGYDTFDAAMAGWTRSPGHRANLLNRDVTQIGVGAAHTDDRYGGYWTLILASPEAARPDRVATGG